MRIKHLMPTLLCLAPLALCGCLSRSEASPSPSPVGTSSEVAGTPAVLVPQRKPLTSLEVAIGLDYEVDRAKMVEIAARIRKEGKYCAQGCGLASDENGKECGAFWDTFLMTIADVEKDGGITLGYLQNEVGLNSVAGDGFVYRLHKGVFYRKSRPKLK